MHISNYLENALVNATLRNQSYSSPASTYLGLYTAVSGDADGVTEVTGDTYARQALDFYPPSDGKSYSSGLIEFPDATASWGTITHGGIYDALTDGNLLYWGELASSRTIESGAAFVVRASGLSVELR